MHRIVAAFVPYSSSPSGRWRGGELHCHAEPASVPGAEGEGSVVGLGDALLAEIDILGSDLADEEIRAVLRRAVAQVNNYLADQTIPTGIAPPIPLAGEKTLRQTNGVVSWLRALVGVSPA